MIKNTNRKLMFGINYLWRVAATGFSFVLFGVGGVLISLASFPFIYMMPLSRHKKSICTQYLLSLLFRKYIGFLKLCGLLTYEIKGRELLKDGGQLVIANHPTLLDVVFLIALIPRANCIVKEGLWRNPLVRGPLSAAGYIKNNSNLLVEQCLETLKRGDSLIIFPAGTRDHENQPLVFLRGTANIALLAGHDITPVVIHCKPRTLGRGEKWYNIPATPPHFNVKICEDIEIQPYLVAGSLRSKMSRKLTTYLEDYYGKNIRC